MAQSGRDGRTLVIGTRGSLLARRQAEIVRNALAGHWPDLTCEVSIIRSRGDEQADSPFRDFGTEGIFVKELEVALLEGRIDIAVHSLKDVPLAVADGLALIAVLKREDARDALVTREGKRFDALPPGASIGTSSLRRRSQLLARRSDLAMKDIRGNVDTRMRKLDAGEYDAISLAASGLHRLGLQARITEYLDLSWVLPEPGQGALVIEAREQDIPIRQRVSVLEDASTRLCIEAERAFLEALGGGCRVPIAAYAQYEGELIELQGSVLSADGKQHIRGKLSGRHAQQVGQQLAEQLAQRGARDILAALKF